jgi:pimeloyl-ACP methyl ester carboxylesterase
MEKLAFAFVLVSILGSVAFADAPATTQSSNTILITRALVLPSMARGGRWPIVVDPIESLRVSGNWRPPHDGDVVVATDAKQRRWEVIDADKDGWFASDALRGGYAFVDVEMRDERVMILDAAGHSLVYVNGEPRGGDPYSQGIVHLPVLLRRGHNQLLFVAARGKLRVGLHKPRDEVYLEESDATLPDFLIDRKESMPGALVAVNATTQPVAVALTGNSKRDPRSMPVAPLSLRKLPFMIDYDGRSAKSFSSTVYLMRDEREVDSRAIDCAVKVSGEVFSRTFISDIDESVQYYSVTPPPADTPAPKGKRALVLSLHGADVYTPNQAKSYSGKSWAYVVCPTNRRPFGFDWEDWGRLDAIEVLARAAAEFDVDPSRVYLTGHSMGGHGAWQLGAIFPDRFAAIGPSAGWISFSSYASSQPTTRTTDRSEMAQILRRAAASSDTLAMLHNYAPLGVYVLHGANDDNVPLSQAREMVRRLGEFHHDFVAYEQPGAGHWWDASDDPGVDCVDWAPMFDFFARHRLPEDAAVREVDFTTVSPEISSACHWATIEAQQHAMQPSTISIRCDPIGRRFIGTSTNVARLSLDTSTLVKGEKLSVQMDDQRIDFDEHASRIFMEQTSDKWRASAKPASGVKNPRRSGPFKQAFKNHMQLVYGTAGTSEENAWSLAKARYDAETWWYRGNGSVDVVPDSAFDPSAQPDRSVILYGNRETLSCWKSLLSESPVQIEPGRVRIASRIIEGEDLACLFIRPRLGSDVACVGVIGGTGLVGMRVTDRLPIFLSGIEYPDVFVASSDMLRTGLAGTRAAGFCDNDWRIEGGDLAWSNDSHQPTTKPTAAPAAGAPN